MIYPVIPGDKKTIIVVQNRHTIVSRFVQTAAYAFEVQPAANWEDLEAEAQRVVEDLVGAATTDYYPCPEELADRAEWSD